MSIEALLPFLKEADLLKLVNRQTLIHSGGRQENSAEHSWHLAIAVLLFQKNAPEDLDMAKAIKMALLHDIVEIDAGDVFVYGDQSAKADKELEALGRLTGLLPEDLAKEFSDIWLEFEKGESPEAKYVSALDRFLPMFSNYLNEGHSWKKHGITSSRVVAKNQPPIQAGLPDLWDTVSKMLENCVSEGRLEE